MYNFDDLYQYAALYLLLYLGVMMQSSSGIIDFLFLYYQPFDMQI